MTRILMIHSMKRSVIPYEKEATNPRMPLPRPVEDSLSPNIHQSYEQDDYEQHHFTVEYVSQRAIRRIVQYIGENDCPGYEEHGFNVEEKKYHRYQIEFDRLAFAG